MERTPPTPFPPHWFTIYRHGRTIGATLQPCTALIQAHEWRLFPDSLRHADMVPLFESLKSEPEMCSLIICYVDSLESAHDLMDAARCALAQFDDKTRDRLFGPTPVPPTEADKPREPLPLGHPDSFTMDELREHLQLEQSESPVPYGKDHQHPQGKKP